MSFVLALFHKINDLFASPHLPLDSDYSFQARYREAERIRTARATMLGIRLVD
ncbi:hypothetical protein B0G57_101319 [Trinickia symbiotica]|uniref:hypothetical protein n=1 Tax=Trinickia symbiotica TaxID=863227 RepID=UPI000367E132|nr:hypothetical protein [Trinickia symbiotica]PPK47354.1 hypothetical protein B0G57_101319 [Trinickia symbiotica]